jgi:hypothetical protein
MTKKVLVLTLALVLALAVSSAVFAQEETPALPVCSGEQATGTLVDFDTETNTATIQTEAGQCTVTFKQEYGHPITTLLANYFGSSDMGGYTEALQATEVCLVQDEITLEWSLSSFEADGTCLGTLANVTGYNETEGTFQFLTSEGEDISLTIEDEETANGLTGALENLMVDWPLNEDGSVTGTGDEIAQYHDDGFGFGVIVKVYGMALASQESCATEEVTTEEVAPADEGTPAEETSCGLNVADLFQALKDGTSVGQLFKLYGKPALLGVGHVRHSSPTGEDSTASGDTSTATGVCNARAHGGKANGKGNVECGDPTTVQLDQNDNQKTNHGKPQNNKNKDKNNNGN